MRNWWLVRGTLLMESGLLRDFFGNFSTRGERYYFRVEGAHKVDVRWELLCKVTNAYTRWLLQVEGTSQWGGTRDGHKVRIESHLVSTSRENFGVVEGTLGHTRWTWGEIWNVILRAPHVRTLLLDVTSSMSQSQMMKICKIFSSYTF